MLIDPASTAKIQERLKQICEWLADEAPYVVADQRHLDVNTPERAYWHYGYQAALADVLALAESKANRKSDSADRSS